MILDYAPDDIAIKTSWEEKFSSYVKLPAPLFRRLKRLSSKRYGVRNDLLRYRAYKLYDIRIGKYSYGYEPFCYRNTRVREIGAFTSIAQNTTASAGNHSIDHVSTHPFFHMKQFGFVEETRTDLIPRNNDIIIGHDVWIGQDVSILTNVTIGTGAVIGAGAVVTRDVPPYAVVMGVPAKVHRYRFNEATITRLLASKWWTWTDDELRENMPEFLNVETFQKKFDNMHY